ncbi:MAG TPA: hypothetical protein VHS78_17670 [Candidatus Elarobacter sp.]|nr:hypothetical protein [Candidatus Elarobacter sp.]
MDNGMTLEETTVTYEMRLGPDIRVHVIGTPAEVVHEAGKEDLTLFDRSTSDRLEVLRGVARSRITNGETEITIDFASGV